MDELKKFKENLKKLPGIGEKSAERIAFFLITEGKDIGHELSRHMLSAIDNIGVCSVCGSLTQTDPCSICTSSRRDAGKIMLVENARDVFLFEKTGQYNGKYHVLGGLISPLDGIEPEHLTIDRLLDRIENYDVNEVIIALSPSTEGESTAMYIQDLLNTTEVTVSRIAFGIPFGSDFEYIDNFTLGRSLDTRRIVKKGQNIIDGDK